MSRQSSNRMTALDIIMW